MAWKVALFSGLLVTSVLGGRMAFAAQDAGSTCTLVVPANPLSARGLATPYELAGCREVNADTAAFVQATIIDPATGAVSVYDPLVLDRGKRPAVTPAQPRLPAGAVVGLWFGFNGDNLVLRGTGNSLSAGRCVNGLDKSMFGQFAYCNAPAFFAAASAAVGAGRLVVPPLGNGRDGLPCPTVRDFGLVDMDQSDNVTSTYLFLSDGSTAQNTAANQAALAARGAKILINGSDNALLDDFLDPALGCVPFTAPDLAQPGRTTTSLALNELQAATFQAAPVALVPPNDPMTVVNGRSSARKSDLYRAGVGQPVLNATADTPAAYCANLAAAGPARTERDRNLTRRGKSPDPGAATNLFTFLAQRLSGAFDALDCGKLLRTKNPVRVVTDKQGVAVDARFTVVAPPPGAGHSPTPTHSVAPTRSAGPTQSRTPTRGATPTRSTASTRSKAPTRSSPPDRGATSSAAARPHQSRSADPGTASGGGGPATGGSAGQPAGGTAGQPAGGTAGQPAGGTAGQPAGGTAGQPAGGTAGQPAGGNAGDQAGDQAGGTAVGAGAADPGDPAGQQATADTPDTAASAATDPAVGAYGTPGSDATEPILPVAAAPVHHTNAGTNRSSLTGAAPATALTVGSMLMAIGIGLRTLRGWRRRQQRVFLW